MDQRVGAEGVAEAAHLADRTDAVHDFRGRVGDEGKQARLEGLLDVGRRRRVRADGPRVHPRRPVFEKHVEAVAEVDAEEGLDVLASPKLLEEGAEGPPASRARQGR